MLAAAESIVACAAKTAAGVLVVLVEQTAEPVCAASKMADVTGVQEVFVLKKNSSVGLHVPVSVAVVAGKSTGESLVGIGTSGAGTTMSIEG